MNKLASLYLKKILRCFCFIQLFEGIPFLQIQCHLELNPVNKRCQSIHRIDAPVLMVILLLSLSLGLFGCRSNNCFLSKGKSVCRLESTANETNEEVCFWVKTIELEYSSTSPDGVPSIEELKKSRINPFNGINTLKNGTAKVITLPLSLSEIGLNGPVCLDITMIKHIQDALVEALNQKGFGAIAVMPATGQIDPVLKQDLRGSTPDSPQPLKLTIWVGALRTVNAQVENESQNKKTDRLAKRILEFSPVRGMDPNQSGYRVDALKIDEISDYLYRLNRHPGRKVSASVNPTDTPGMIDLEYQVTQNKPWLLYGQTSNTGTEHSGLWRNRMGFIHNQLTGHDDILSLDYLTSDFSDLHSFSINYDSLLPGTLDTRYQLNAARSTYQASDLGERTDFEGTDTQIRGQLSWTFWQQDSIFLDSYIGLEWARHEVNNRLVNVSGLESIWTGQTGILLEKEQGTTRTYATVELSWSMPEWSGAGQTGLTKLGRIRPDEQWLAGHYSVRHSLYLDSLFDPNTHNNEISGIQNRQRHELLFNIRGQLTRDRLIPQERMALGGLYSVRGYPQSMISGDSVVIVGSEYRYHLGYDKRNSLTRTNASRHMQYDRDWWQSLMVDNWDCALKLFCDAGKSWNSSKTSYENNESLIGAGVGMDLWFNRQMNIRCDIGCPLTGVRGYKERVDPGDLAVHFVGTITF